MEKRSSPRDGIRVNVVVNASGNDLISGKTRDVGPHGMYIETRDAVSMTQGGPVRVGFMLGERLKIARAQVTHVGESGFGLRVDPNQAEALLALQSLREAYAGAVADAPRRNARRRAGQAVDLVGEAG